MGRAPPAVDSPDAARRLEMSATTKVTTSQPPAAAVVLPKRKGGLTKALLLLGGNLVALLGLGWAGLQVEPAPLPAMTAPPASPETIPLPEGLPAPVERLYRQTYGEQIPVIYSAALSGRGSMRLFGVTLPTRFRFVHEAERNFRAYFEVTLFGRAVMKVDEHYVDGKFRSEGTPAGVEENEPKLDHSANLRMYAEWLTWLPAMLLTDPQVRWEPVDDTMALLVVPSGDGEERLVVRFDPATGEIQYWEALKYKYPEDVSKTLWINATWFGDRPWATFSVEEIVYNAAVDTSFTRKGP